MGSAHQADLLDEVQGLSGPAAQAVAPAIASTVQKRVVVRERVAITVQERVAVPSIAHAEAPHLVAAETATPLRRAL